MPMRYPPHDSGIRLKPRKDAVLEEVEIYLVEQAEKGDYWPADAPQPGTLIQWLRNRFAELRSREDAKAFM